MHMKCKYMHQLITQEQLVFVQYWKKIVTA